METRLKLGISACLLGQKVRYDGRHKLEPFLKNTMGQYVEYVAVCPEVECGLPVPRKPLCLVGDSEAPRLVTIQNNRDYTPRMKKWARICLSDLKKRGISGFIFKSNSPSCGLHGVKVQNEKGGPAGKARGIFAGLFVGQFPIIPVEDETRLCDPGPRETFFESVFATKRWLRVLSGERSFENLIDFHGSNRLLILSHSRKYLGLMEKALKTGKSAPVRELYDLYEGLLTEALKHKTTPKKNVRAFERATAYLDKRLTPDEKQELIKTIQTYGQGHAPFLAPATRIIHYARKYQCHDLDRQVFLHPDPIELCLKNHACGRVNQHPLHRARSVNASPRLGN